jgi:hypothetical protein
MTVDPLLESGILKSYPPNPFGPFLRSHRFNMKYLLTGLGPATSPVDMDDPRDKWEARWFPVIRTDPKFGSPDMILCANGLCQAPIGRGKATDMCMNGSDYVPGCFFYRAYDFNGDGLADDYILGMYGWPNGCGTDAVDLIDGKTGEISLYIDSHGCIRAGNPDGRPEAVYALHVANTPVPKT